MLHETALSFLKHNCSIHADKVAIICGGRNMSYAEVDGYADQVAQWLSKEKVAPGSRILLCATNSGELVSSLFGAWKVGAAIVPIHPGSPREKFLEIAQDCQPSALVLDENSPLATTFKQKWPNLPILELPLGNSEAHLSRDSIPGVTHWQWLPPRGAPHRSEKPIMPESLAAILYTSGTTKRPRGVVSYHHHIVFAASAINKVIRNVRDDVILCGLPLSFDYGLYQIFLAFQVGATVALEPSFPFPALIPSIIQKHGVTGFPGVPSLFAMLLQSRVLERVRLPSLRYLTSTGDVFPPAHIIKLAQLLPHAQIIPMYGLTECKRVSIMPPERLAGREGSTGLPLPGTKVKVVDANGIEVTPGNTGELVVEGPHVMAGYWQSPEETATRYRSDPVTGSVSLFTGDQFHMDEEGFLYFVGRDEMLIKSRGHRVSAAEIEAVLYELPGVAEAAAVGVPDRIVGEKVCAFVCQSSNEMVLSKLTDWCNQNLAKPAQPQHFFLMNVSLPKTANGKIDRAELRRMAAEQLLD